MRGYQAFVRKEFLEAARTYKAFLLLGIFLLIGILNPLTAKFLPVLFKTLQTQGVTVSMGEIHAKDSWEQFYKNVPQMGLIITAVLFSGMLPAEFGKGTLIPMLAKGVRRDAILLAKFTVSLALFTAAYVLCAAVTGAYTAYYWPEDSMKHMWESLFMVWLFGVFMLSLLLLMGTLTKKMAGALLGTAGIVAACFVARMIPGAEGYDPVSLVSSNMEILLGSQSPGHYLGAMVLTAGAAVMSLILSILVFRKETV